MSREVAVALGRVGVLLGGCSSEREISFKSGKAVVAALAEEGCQVQAIEINTTDEQQLTALLKAAGLDLAFIAMHGKFGEDGTIQAFLERIGIPYTGSDARASRLAMDKVATQDLLAGRGVLVPRHVVMTTGQPRELDKILAELGGLPVVVKPSREGSSIGVTIVTKQDQLAVAIEEAFRYGSEILVEQYIRGRELTCGILDRVALPLVEIRSQREFFDYEAKYQKGLSQYIVPAEIPVEHTGRIQAAALQVADILGCSDFVRMDFILDAAGKAYFLEANTIPGFTATSLLPMAAKQAGYSFGSLCLRIAQLGRRKAVAWENAKRISTVSAD